MGEGKLQGFSISHLRFAIQDAFFSILLQILSRLDIRISVDGRQLEAAIDSLHQPARGVMPARPQQLAASGDLDGILTIGIGIPSSS